MLLDAPLGFEPSSLDSKSSILPIDEGAITLNVIIGIPSRSRTQNKILEVFYDFHFTKGIRTITRCVLIVFAVVTLIMLKCYVSFFKYTPISLYCQLLSVGPRRRNRTYHSMRYERTALPLSYTGLYGWS